MYYGDIRLGDTIDIKFTTRSFTTGAPSTLGGTPAVSAYVGNGTTEITAGITLSADFDGRTGLNNVRVVASSGNGFATATNVQLVITTGTVGGVSVVGEVIGSFSIEARSALMPTTAARTLDVSSGGEAGVDWANVGSPTTTVSLTNTTVGTVTTVTNQLTAAAIATGVWQDAVSGDFTVASSIGKSLYTGNVVPGASGGHFISGSNAGTTTVGALTVTGATTLAAVSGTTLSFSGATTLTGNVSIAGGLSITQSSSNTPALSVTGNGAASGAVFTSGSGATGDGIQATSNADNGSGLRLTSAGTGSGLLTDKITASGAVAFGSTFAVTGTTTFNAFTITNAFTVSGATTLTGAVTGTNASNDLRINGAVPGAAGGLFIAGTNAATVVTTSFTTTFTGNLTGNVGGNVTGSVGSVVGDIGGLAAGAITDVEDAVWDAVLANHLDAGSTGFALNAAGSAGDPWGTALPGAYGAGTAGFIIGTNLDATVSSRSTLTQTQVTGGAYSVQSASCVLGDARIANLDATVSSRSTLTQTQVTGGAYTIQSASCVLGDARIANLDATVSSRAPSSTALSTATWTNGLATNIGTTNTTVATNLDAAVSSRMATYTQPTGFLAATFPGTVASTTNITAGTITTVGTVTNPVTVGTNNDKTGYALSGSQTFNMTGNITGNLSGTVGSIADPGNVWDVALASHVTAGSTGLALQSASSAGDPWNTPLPGAYAAGTAGYMVGNSLGEDYYGFTFAEAFKIVASVSAGNATGLLSNVTFAALDGSKTVASGTLSGTTRTGMTYDP